ncbi:Gfo/Idh/MocA family oxidoreductase [Mucilaginibacter sp. BJC16-A38]|uniref:Gfo/Idh/MocA family protein n=1 Tax=Mucilaginibacter phenanthrenivorans TaxID=1234842 RepID=UPI0021575171|nr:Gfo/Idh/MocA family oxidoreductase [Mucilaginibacter phenanthrenivorans]MCR8558738.1 Gfo/Idh/MocA family oxidoreductase [Mucilaginibacter phenanthrenivorans]
MIKWGIIGCGRIAHRFVQGLKAVPGTELVSLWSRRPETVIAFSEQHGGHACATVEELLASDIDAVYIATLPDSHPEYCFAAFNAGKHVLCEKPAAINLDILNPILEAARSKGLLFMEAMKPPFFPLYSRLKEYLITNPIGPVGYVRAGSSVADIPRDHPNFSYDYVGGAIMQIGIYEAFLAVDWLGETQQVQTMGRFGGTGIDMFAIFQTLHTNGYAQLYAGFDLHGKGDALICGTIGHITIHKNWWNPSKATINYLDGRIVVIDEPFTAGGLNYEIEHFCELIKAGKIESNIVSYDMSRQMIAMLDKAREQVGLRFKGE